MDGMNISEVLNVLLGGGLVATIVAICTLRATIRKAKAESMKAEADAETVRMDNAEHATRILVENIVKPLKEELNETRRYLEASKREMARLRKAIDTANSCKHHDDCPVLVGLRDKPKASVATEESVKQVSADTLQSEVRQTWTETVPQEEAKLEIPLAELTNLPERQSTEPRTDEPAQPCRTKVAPSLCMPLATVCNASASTMNARWRATRKHWSSRRMKPKRKGTQFQSVEDASHRLYRRSGDRHSINHYNKKDMAKVF